MVIGTTIDGLNAVTSLTANDEVPLWDAEASGEPTKKITASNLASSVKSLAALPNNTEMNAAIAQSTATAVFTPTPSASITDLASVDTHCYYCAATKTVHLAIRYYSPSGKIPKANNAIAVVPVAYKPSVIRSLGPALLTTISGSSMNGSTCFETCYIDTTGTIRLNNFATGTSAAYIFAISTDYLI